MNIFIIAHGVGMGAGVAAVEPDAGIDSVILKTGSVDAAALTALAGSMTSVMLKTGSVDSATLELAN